MQNLAIKGGLFQISLEKNLISEEGLPTCVIEEGFWRSEASLEQSSVSREGEVQVGGSRKCRSVPRVAGVRSSSGNKVDEDNTRKSGRVRCGKS